MCIGTSAAPTYFSPHYFVTKDADGSMHRFDLIDGGVAANNPVSETIFFFVLCAIVQLVDYSIQTCLKALINIIYFCFETANN